jgi:hypothetical protein
MYVSWTCVSVDVLDVVVGGTHKEQPYVRGCGSRVCVYVCVLNTVWACVEMQNNAMCTMGEAKSDRSNYMSGHPHHCFEANCQIAQRVRYRS